jgi:hypothetical protein
VAMTIETVTDVLAQLHDELGAFDPDTRALVALRATGEDTVDLKDVQLAENGVLRADDDVDALVLVTGEMIELTDADEIVPLRQLVAVLRDGEEVGVFRIGGDDDAVYHWSTTEPDGNVETMRPRDVAANAARRALGHPSHTPDIPITELLSRLWLLHVAQLTLERFDANGGEPVDVDQLASADTRGPFAAILDDPAYADDELEASRELAAEIAWEDVRQLAVRGDLEIGPYVFDPEHADWLDDAGFAQYFDRTVMSTEEILASLDVMGDSDLVAWAIDELVRRDWRAPSLDAVTAGRR